jgi:hypothetical protein
MQTSPAQQLADNLGDIWQVPVYQDCEGAAYTRRPLAIMNANPVVNALIDISTWFLRSDFIDEVRLDDRTYCGPCEFRLEHNQVLATERYNFVDGVAKLNPPLNIKLLTGIRIFYVQPSTSGRTTFVYGKLNSEAGCNLLKALVPSPVSYLAHYLTTWSSTVQFRSSTAPVKQTTLDLPQQQEAEAEAKQTTVAAEQEQQQEAETKQTTAELATSETQTTTLLAAPDMQTSPAQQLADKLGDIWQLFVIPGPDDSYRPDYSYHPNWSFGGSEIHPNWTLRGGSDGVAYSRFACAFEASTYAPTLIDMSKFLRYQFIDEVRLDDRTYCGPCEFQWWTNKHYDIKKYNFVDGVAKINPPINVSYLAGTDIRTYFVRSRSPPMSGKLTFVCGVVNNEADRNLLKSLNSSNLSLTSYMATWSSTVQFRSPTAPVKQLTLDLPKQKEAEAKQTILAVEQQQNATVATDENQTTTLLATVQALEENVLALEKNDERARMLAAKRAELTKLLSQYFHSELVQHANMHQELSEQLCAQIKLTKTAQAETKAASAKYADVMSVLQSLVPAAL